MSHDSLPQSYYFYVGIEKFVFSLCDHFFLEDNTSSSATFDKAAAMLKMQLCLQSSSQIGGHQSIIVLNLV